MRRLRLFASRFAPPHRLLALLLVADGLLLLRPVVLRAWRHMDGGWFQDSLALFDTLGVSALPQAVVATGLAVMAVGVALRARLAWGFSLLLLMAAAGITVWGGYGEDAVLAFTIALAGLLLFYWRRFNRTSLAAGTLFAVLSIGALVIYAVFGAL
ncbi:MAG TPA: voltage-gated potassium channel TrkA, partial [Paraburkholderia sp.]